MVKDNKAASVQRRKEINKSAQDRKRDSKKVNSRKEHDTGGRDLQGRSR